MVLTEIEREIKPLSVREKVELMRFLADELAQAEELAHNREPAQEVTPSPDDELLAHVFPPGAKYGLWSQYNAFSAAQTLQTLLETTSPEEHSR